MTTCPHPYDLQSFADGGLNGSEKEHVERHLHECELCASRVAGLHRLRDLLQSRHVPVPDDLLERILNVARTAMPVRKLACRTALETASEYIDDELNALERETLEAHMFACETCYREYVAMRTAANAMREAPRVPVHSDLRDRIFAAIAEDTAQPEPVIGRISPVAPLWRRALAPAAAVAAVALLTFGVIRVGYGPAEPPAMEIAAVTPAVDTTPGPVNSGTAGPGETVAVASAAAVAGLGANILAEDEPGEAPLEAPAETTIADASPTRASDPVTTDYAPEPVRERSNEGASALRDSRPRPVEITRPMPERNLRPMPTRVIEPPAIAMVEQPARGTSGLTSRSRTVERTDVAPAREFRMPAPLPAETVVGAPATGVIASRPLGELPPGTTATRVAAAPLTRPEPRVAKRTVIEPTPVKPEPEEGRLASRGWVPTTAPRETIYSNDAKPDEALRTISRSINTRFSRDRRMGEDPGWPIDD